MWQLKSEFNRDSQVNPWLDGHVTSPCERDSPENAKEFVIMSPHVMPHPIVSRVTSEP